MPLQATLRCASIAAALCVLPILPVFAQGETAGRVLSSGASPFSETWDQIRKRDSDKQAQTQAEIRAGRRPAEPIPRRQPEEGIEREEEEILLPGPDSGPSTAPIERRSSLRGITPRQPQGVSTNFKGDDLQDIGTLTGFYYIPPDTMGAMGPNHFMELTNGSATVYNTSGTRLSSVSLDSFFTITVGAVTYPQNGSTDPRIHYDRRSGRWFACIIEIGTSTAGENNNILLAVCRTGDPISGTWDKYVVPVAIPKTAGRTYFNDYESLATDDNGVYFGMRVFASNNSSRARIVVTPKAPLVAASPSLGAITDFDNIADMYSTPMPANNHDAVAPTGRVWFVSSNHQFYANLNYRRLTWSGSTPTLDAASTVLTTPAFAAPLDAPSSGGTQDIDVGDMRVMMAVIRNNRLWLSRHVGVNSTGGSTGADRTACEFMELDVSGAAASLVQSGRVYDTAATNPRFYYYPAVMVSGQGHVAMGMSGSSTSEFVASYTCGRYASDAAGVMGLPTLFKAGEAKYTVTFGGPSNRWGDYSYTSLDPGDDMTMWTIQEYARTPVSTQDIWGTWISRLLAPGPTLNNPAATGMQGQVGANLPLTGTGFYDPGAGFPKRLSIVLNGGAINGISNYSVTYSSPTSATVTFDIAANASLGTRDIVLTNPDGQTATAVGGFTVTAPLSANQAPVVTVPGGQTVAEDTNLTITGIGVSDPDVGAGQMQMTLSALNGTLTLGSTAGLSFSSGANGTALMVFTGTLASVNGALASVVYRASTNYSGADTVTVTANDQGNTGSGGPLGDTKTVAVTVNAVNDPPVVTVPGSQTVPEDTNLTITGIGLSDPDVTPGQMQMTLSALNGTLTLGSTAGLSFSSGANGTASMVFTGTLASVNGALASVVYRASTNYSGADTVTVTANDQGNTGSGGPLGNTKTIAVTVNAANDPPVVTVPGGQTVAEDTNLTITGISVSDPDVAPGQMQMTLSALNGTLTLGSTAGLSFSSGANGTASMVFTGTLASVNGALASVVYRASTNYSGADTVTVTANDQGNTGSGGPLGDTKTIAVTVNAVNDPPVVTVPGGQTVAEDTNLTITGIGVSDPDVGAGQMQMTLSALNGTLTLGSTAGLSFSSGANGAASMVFTGTLASVNGALASVVYRASTNYSGADTVTVTANDQGNTGSGGPLGNTKTIAVTVNAVNDPPVLTVPGTQLVLHDTDLTIPAVLISDPDDTTGSMYFSATASHGSLRFVSTAGLAAISGNNSPDLRTTGTLSSLNAALAAGNFIYSAIPAYSGPDTIICTADDLGASGAGGPQSDTQGIPITVDVPIGVSVLELSMVEPRDQEPLP